MSIAGNAGWVRSETLDMFLVITNRASITVSYYLINLLNMELYPTCLRQSGMSLGNLVSSGASAIAPYVIYLVSSMILICTEKGDMGCVTTIFMFSTLCIQTSTKLHTAAVIFVEVGYLRRCVIYI